MGVDVDIRSFREGSSITATARVPSKRESLFVFVQSCESYRCLVAVRPPSLRRRKGRVQQGRRVGGKYWYGGERAYELQMCRIALRWL